MADLEVPGHTDEPHTLDFCCGGRKCPQITEKPDGFAFMDEGETVRLTFEQAERLIPWLQKRLAAAR